jgi:hypothetical protein
MSVFTRRVELPSDFTNVAGVAVASSQCLADSRFHTQIYSAQPQAGFGNVMGNQVNYLDIKVDAPINELKMFAVEFYITNSGVTGNLELLPPHLWIGSNGIECRVDASVVQTHYPESLMFDYEYMTDESRSIYSAFMQNTYSSTLMERNASATTPLGVLAPGASQYFYLPITSTLFQQSKLPLCAITSDIVYRFYFNQFSGCVASTNTATSLTIGSLQLILGGTVRGNNIDNTVNCSTLNGDISASYYSPERFPFQFSHQTADNNLKATFNTLSGGIYSSLILFVRQQSAIQEQVSQWNYSGTTYNPTNFAIQTATLNDQSGRPYGISSINPAVSKYANIIMSADNDHTRFSTFPQLFSYVKYSFGASNWDEFRNGQCCGLRLNNSWNYIIQLSGNYIDPQTGCELVYVAQRLYECRLMKSGKLVAVPQ